MRAVQRLRFQPAAHLPRVTRIDRYLNRDDHASGGSWATAPAWTELDSVEISLVDTSSTTGELAPQDDAAMIWHVLWVRDERASRVTVDGSTWPIVPGDSIAVPPGTPLQAEAGQLAIAVSVPGSGATIAPPTHGEERFFGYNRQTVCRRVGGIRLCRWKLTQPLTLAEHHPRPVLTLGLARSSLMVGCVTLTVALRTRGGQPGVSANSVYGVLVSGRTSRLPVLGTLSPLMVTLLAPLTDQFKVVSCPAMMLVRLA